MKIKLIKHLWLFCLVCCCDSLIGQHYASFVSENDLKRTTTLSRIDFKPKMISQDMKTTIKNRYTETLPFFCRMEHNIEKSSKINLRLRIGDLNYVNYLENKNQSTYHGNQIY